MAFALVRDVGLVMCYDPEVAMVNRKGATMRWWRVILLLVACLVAASCSDDASPTAPAESARPSNGFEVRFRAISLPFGSPTRDHPWEGYVNAQKVIGSRFRSVYLPLDTPLPIRARILSPALTIPLVTITEWVDNEIVDECYGYPVYGGEAAEEIVSYPCTPAVRLSETQSSPF
jgi:hypothetical protein